MLISYAFLLCFINAQAFDLNLFGTKPENITTTVKWPDVNRLFHKVINSLPMPNLVQLFRISREMNLSPECQASLFQTYNGLRNTKSFAVHMADATGKIPSGILDGTTMDFGSYEECLKVRVNSFNGTETFRGRYCMVGFKSPLLGPFLPNTSKGEEYVEKYGLPPEWIEKEIVRAGGFLKRVAFWLGMCFPSTCVESDLEKFLTYVSKPLGLKVSIADCQLDGPKHWTVHTIVAVCILGFIIALCIIGTTFDCISRIKMQCCVTNYSLLRLMKAFSFLSNTEKLFSNIPEGGKLGCFNGIRFFSATWIVLGHTYFFTDTWKYLKYRNLLGLQEIFNRHLPVAILENFTIPVGSFFFMSGFLLVYSTWKKLEKNGGRLNLLKFFIHKYWRMSPALGLMIVMLMAMPLISSGPIWNSTLDAPIRACRKHWWTNMLYINNWWDSEDFCLIHTWYLAALMQFHLVGVIVLMLSYWLPMFGAFVGFTISIGCCIITSLIAAANNFPMPAPAVIRDMDIVDDYNSKIYIKSFNHIVTYFMGMWTAHLILKYKDKRLSATCQVLGWILAITGALTSVYGLYGPAESVIIRSFYIGFHRIGWTFGVSWVAYSCITGNGGIINRILSWKAFIPLGQLSYLVYLIHPLVILFRTASLRERAYYGHTDLVFDYLAYTIISFFIAYVGYVTVEIPFTVLEGIVFKRNSVNLKEVSNQKEIPITTCDIKTVAP